MRWASWPSGASSCAGVGVESEAAAPLQHPLRVRYSECDAQGVVFNSHYLAWFDINMTELWRAAFGSYQAAVERGVDIVVVSAELSYGAPARFDDLVTLSVAVAALGTTSITTRHAVLREGRTLVRGTLRHVMVDPATLVKTPIPEWVRSGLAPWTLADDPASEPDRGTDGAPSEPDRAARPVRPSG